MDFWPWGRRQRRAIPSAGTGAGTGAGAGASASAGTGTGAAPGPASAASAASAAAAATAPTTAVRSCPIDSKAARGRVHGYPLHHSAAIGAVGRADQLHHTGRRAPPVGDSADEQIGV